jgi:hypothetical protein
MVIPFVSRSQWPRGLRRMSTAARLLILWVRFPPRAWMFVFCECLVLSGRGLCDGLITRPEESYRLWRVVCVTSKTSWMRRPYPALGCSATLKKSPSYGRQFGCGTFLLNLTDLVYATNMQFLGSHTVAMVPFLLNAFYTSQDSDRNVQYIPI